MMDAMDVLPPRFAWLGSARVIGFASTPRGALALREAAAGVYYIRIDGIYTLDIYQRGFLAKMQAELPKHEAIHLFTDGWDAVGYEGAVRTAATDFMIEHHAKVTGAVLLVRSRLVAMGANTAAMILALRGIRLHVHSELVVFEQALRSAVDGR